MPFRDQLLIASVTSAGIVIAALITGYFTYRSADRTVEGKLVELGVGILSADPSKSDVSPARGWAIKVIEKHSDVTFSNEAKEFLMKRSILDCKDHAPSLDFSKFCNSTFIPAL